MTTSPLPQHPHTDPLNPPEQFEVLTGEHEVLGDRAAEADADFLADAAYLAAVHGGVSTDVDTGTDRTTDPTQAGIDQGRLLGVDAEQANDADAVGTGADRSVDQPSTLAQVVAADLARQAAEQGQAWTPARPPWYDDYAPDSPELASPELASPELASPELASAPEVLVPVEQAPVLPESPTPVETPLQQVEQTPAAGLEAYYEAAGIKRSGRRPVVMPPSTRTLPKRRPGAAPLPTPAVPAPVEQATAAVPVHPVTPAHPATESTPTPISEPVPTEEPIDYEYQQMLEEQALAQELAQELAEQEGTLFTTPDTSTPTTSGVSPGVEVVTNPRLLGGNDFDHIPDDTTPDTDSDGESTGESTQAQTAGGKKKKQGIQLTPRDIEFLTFLARYKYATYPQLMARFNVPYQTLRRRFPQLERAGLVTKEAAHKSAFLVWAPTRAGISTAGLDLPPVEINSGSMNHTLGLVELGLQYENHFLANPGPEDFQVVTEREIRAADTRAVTTPGMRRAYAATGQALPILGGTDVDIAGFTPEELGQANRESRGGFLYCVQYTNPDGKTLRTHIPDMVLVGNPNPDGTPTSIAIELELNHKSPDEWTKILRAYKQAPHIAGVVYYTHRRKVATAINNIATAEGIGHRVQIKKFAFSDHLSHLVLSKD